MTLADRVEDLLGPAGPFARRWPHFEARPGQLALARDVALAMERGGVLLAEAPTGVGKSLAYLLPAVLLAAGEERRVGLATCTRSLQDQLFERDLPAVLDALGLAVSCARLKGKQNYVCPRALDLAEPEAAAERAEVGRLRAWAAADEEGDLDRFPAADAEAFRRLRPRVAADPHACTAATCRRGRECPWARARRAAAQARVVVVNHALLAIAGEAEGLLPEFDVLVVDEAHRLEGVLLAQLERAVSRHRFEETLRLLGTGRRGGQGLLARARAGGLPLLADPAARAAREGLIEDLATRVGMARGRVEALFARLEPAETPRGPYGERTRYRRAEDLLGRDLAPVEAVLEDCAALQRDLLRLADALAAAGEEGAPLAAEAEQVAGQVATLRADLDRVTSTVEEGWVHWRSAGGRGLELHAAPITVGAHARRLVLGRARAAVLTSATLAAGDDFGFVAERLGLGERFGLPFEAGRYPSPFDLARQVAVFTLDSGADEAAAVAEAVAALAGATRRNLLALFTAHERLRRARELLRGRLPHGVPLLAQEWDGPAGILAERFRLERGAVLLGVQSLWEGVDFPGESLEILVVAKLPFAVPDDPIVEARGERLREQGLDPFRHDAVPEAVLRFRQGVGRLIRRATDRGVLVVCDPRLERARYRRPFLEALPAPPRRVPGPAALAEEAARFLGAAAAVEEET
uniref:ATP-dependent DNA helicase n=1 Tax=Eiseniibacteriota bacterium TaxID=2212470 RepID=A0A832I3F2_UNCEI